MHNPLPHTYPHGKLLYDHMPSSGFAGPKIQHKIENIQFQFTKTQTVGKIMQALRKNWGEINLSGIFPVCLLVL